MTKKNTILFGNLLCKLEKKIPFLGMNPLNSTSEKKRFFKRPGYNPVFRYGKPPSGADKLFAGIGELKLEDNYINNLLMKKLEKFKKTHAMIQSLGTDEFSFFSKEIFGVPDQALVDKSYEILGKESEKEEGEINSKQVVGVMKKVLEDFGLDKWVVSTKKMAANAAVSVASRKVYVKKNSRFPASFLKRVVVHEIGTHVFRGANGAKQPHEIFRTGLPGYLMTEEGMAVNAEEMNGVLKINTLRTYAGRAIAVHLSQKKSFREVFDELRKYFDDSTAWKVTLRAKRGLDDTSKPGAYTKDYLYLKGYYEVKKFLEEKGDQGLKVLYYGRIGLGDVPIIKEMKGLVEPELTPISDKFKKILHEINV